MEDNLFTIPCFCTTCNEMTRHRVAPGSNGEKIQCLMCGTSGVAVYGPLELNNEPARFVKAGDTFEVSKIHKVP